MLRSLFGSRRDSPKSLPWQESQAHLLLLSKFLDPQEPKKYARRDEWQTVLGQPVAKAIRQFVDEGMLVSPNLAELVDLQFRVSDLRSMLRERGLTISGPKANMIARLLEADPSGMKTLVSGTTVLQCSARGKQVVEEYLCSEKAKGNAYKRGVLQMLQKGKYHETSLIRASYEAGQVFPRGMGIDWKHYDQTGWAIRDVAILRYIFERTPKVLVSVTQEELHTPRIAAGMMYVIGSWADIESHLPTDPVTGRGRDNLSYAANMLLSHALYLAQFQTLRETGLRMSIEIGTCNDEHVCPACRRMASKKYRLHQLPELPYEQCTCASGCRCWLL
ncbi:MAG: SAP domain-containing protein [Anaerolineae bacterium]